MNTPDERFEADMAMLAAGEPGQRARPTSRAAIMATLRNSNDPNHPTRVCVWESPDPKALHAAIPQYRRHPACYDACAYILCPGGQGWVAVEIAEPVDITNLLVANVQEAVTGFEDSWKGAEWRYLKAVVGDLCRAHLAARAIELSQRANTTITTDGGQG